MKKILVYQNYILAIIIAIGLFVWIYGFEVLNPVNTSWIMEARHDWGTHYLGWAFYKDEPWQFPLGKTEHYSYPSGANVGFTDSIPLFALLFKPFAAILPADFQYLGLFLFSCYILLAIYTVKLFNLYKIQTIYILAGVVIIVGNPVLVYRGMHPSLCCHWLIIASLYYYLKPATVQNVASINGNQVLLVILSSLIHPYITLMTAGFTVVTPLKHFFYDKVISFKRVVVYPIITLAIIILLWLAVGLISIGAGAESKIGGGYGLNSMNLNALYNPGGFGYFYRELQSATFHQYEGFMYLGVGMMTIIGVSIIILLAKRHYAQRIKKTGFLVPLFILVAGNAMFAITNIVTFNTKTLLTIPLPLSVIHFGEVFRASARFFWPAYYIIILFFFLILVKSKFPNYAKTTLVFVFLALQVYDVKPIYTFRHFNSGQYDTPLTESKWNSILPHYKRMITYPPFKNDLLNPQDYQDLCFLALKNNMAISAGYSARDNGIANNAFKDSLRHSIYSGAIRKDEIYITTKESYGVFENLLHNNNVTHQIIDGYDVFYIKAK